ncbi:MAG: hypothetical protein ABEL76_17200 [Bradymonadaceae bacterium]
MRSLSVWSAIALLVSSLMVGACSSSGDGGGGDSPREGDAANRTDDGSSGSDDSTSGDGPCPGVGESTPDSVAVGDLGCQSSVAMCSFAFDCCTNKERRELSELQTATLNLSSRKKCIKNYKGRLTLFIRAVQQAIDNGRAEYNPKAAASCIEKIRSSCTGRTAAYFKGGASTDAFVSQFVRTCSRQIVTPLVEKGGDCKEPFECKTGRCVKDSPGDLTGTCKAFSQKGDSCSLSASKACKGDLFCFQGTCKERRGKGANCSGALHCKSGYCTSDGTCQPKTSGGESCGGNTACESGLCAGAGNGSDGSCLPAPICDGS